MASIKFRVRGTAVKPRCDKPYKWDGDAKKFLPNVDGEFSLQVALSAEQAAPIIEQIKQAAKDAGLKKMKNEPYAPEVDWKTEEETGRTVFTFKQNGKDRNGNAMMIPHFDSKGKALPKSFMLTSGSEVVVQSHTYAYTTLGGGVKLFLDGVQVVKYVERNAIQFDVVEDGFDFVEDESVTSDTSTDDVTDGLASSDF